MTGQEMVALSKQHSLFEWSAQAHVDPIPVAKSKGIYFWTPEGKRYIDFNSQLMCVNIGHSDPRVIKARPLCARGSADQRLVNIRRALVIMPGARANRCTS